MTKTPKKKKTTKATEEEDVSLEYWRLVEIFRDFILQVGLEAGTGIHVSVLC